MCGFAGVVAWDSRFAVTREQLARMSDAIAHRGPDGEGNFFTDTLTPAACGLAHRRLAIIDPDPRANQPFSDARGRQSVPARPPMVVATTSPSTPITTHIPAASRNGRPPTADSDRTARCMTPGCDHHGRRNAPAHRLRRRSQPGHQERAAHREGRRRAGFVLCGWRTRVCFSHTGKTLGQPPTVAAGGHLQPQFLPCTWPLYGLLQRTGFGGQ